MYEVDSGTNKAAVTATFTFSAGGDLIPPMLIFPCKRIPADIVATLPKRWGIGRSGSGWMTAEAFYECIANVFSPYLTMNNVQLPVILFVDGHKTHLTHHVSKLCSELNIVLIALYPNATSILQPNDVAEFRPIKAGWSEEIRLWRQTHLHENITRSHVAPLLEKILPKKKLSQILQNGFRTGLCPWYSNVLDYRKCLEKIQTKS